MPLILVVEQEQRYVERIAEALSPQGWEVLGVEDREAALAHRADDSASLLIVSGEVPDAADLVTAFARRSGGPGAVVLVAEDADDGVRRLGADEVLKKPFTDQQIRLAVRRCLVGLSSRESEPEPEEAEVAAPTGMGERLTSEDLFGDMVSELESVFKFGDGTPVVEEEEAAPLETTEEVTETDGEVEEAAPAAVETIEAVSEEAAPAIDEEAPEPEVAEEEIEAAGEEPPEAVVEIEEVDLAADLEEVDEEVAAVAEVEEDLEEADEEVAALAEVEGELEEAELEEAGVAEDESAAAAVAEESEVEEEVAGPAEPTEDLRQAPPAPPPKPRRDPAAVLEERIRRAAEEGKRLAAKPTRSRRRGKDLGRSTESLLAQALQGIDEETPKPRRKHRRATEDEVEELVESVVRDEEEEEAEALVEASDASDSLVLEVLGEDEHQRHEDEYQTRMRLVWAVILIVALGLLAFFLVRRAGNDSTPAEPMPPAIEEQQPATPPAETEGAEGEDTTGAAAATEPTDEEALERELEAQRRQLKEEIAKSRAAAEEDGP